MSRPKEIYEKGNRGLQRVLLILAFAAGCAVMCENCSSLPITAPTGPQPVPQGPVEPQPQYQPPAPYQGGGAYDYDKDWREFTQNMERLKNWLGTD